MRASSTEMFFATFISGFGKKFRKVVQLGWMIDVVRAVNQKASKRSRLDINSFLKTKDIKTAVNEHTPLNV